MEEEYEDIEEKETNKNKEFKIRKKYSPKYILMEKLIELYIAFILFIVVCFSSNHIAYGFFAVFVLAVIVIGVLIVSKKNAQKTYMIFYEDKIVFHGRMLWITKERTLHYSEIKDITFTQGASFWERSFQKAFHFGNIYVYPKKGNLLTNGMQIELVANIEEVTDKIRNMVGDKIG